MNDYIFIDNSDKFIDAMHDKAEIALEECGLLAMGYAQENLTNSGAVDTGNLRGSIAHKVVMSESEGGGTAYIGTNVEYGPYIEYGTGIYAEGILGGRQTPWIYQDSKGDYHMTHGMKARPFLKPAVEDHKRDYKEIIKTELKS